MENETLQQIPSSFDDFIKEEVPENKEGQDTMEARFAKERVEWKSKVQNMSIMMKRLPDVAELMTNIYTERQQAVEYYHYLLTLLQKVNKTYRKQFSEKYDFYTYKSQKRFPNDIVIGCELLSSFCIFDF